MAPAGAPSADRKGPRRDERGDQREQDPKGQGYGIKGFVNNPFAKLGDLKKS